MRYLCRVFSIGRRRRLELLKVFGLTASSSLLQKSVCTFGYKESRLIALCRYRDVPLREVRLVEDTHRSFPQVKPSKRLPMKTSSLDDPGRL